MTQLFIYNFVQTYTYLQVQSFKIQVNFEDRHWKVFFIHFALTHHPLSIEITDKHP